MIKSVFCTRRAVRRAQWKNSSSVTHLLVITLFNCVGNWISDLIDNEWLNFFFFFCLLFFFTRCVSRSLSLSCDYHCCYNVAWLCIRPMRWHMFAFQHPPPVSTTVISRDRFINETTSFSCEQCPPCVTRTSTFDGHLTKMNRIEQRDAVWHWFELNEREARQCCCFEDRLIDFPLF